MSAQPKDVWDKVQAFAALTASIFIPIAALVVGNAVSTSQKNSENRVKYVEVAVSILRTEPTESTRSLREWAVEVLAAQSPVVLSAAARDELKKQQVDLGWTDMDPKHYQDNNRSYKNPTIDTVVTTQSKK